MMYRHILKPILFSQDAEKAHERTLKFAALVHHSKLLQGITHILYGSSDAGLSQNLMGIEFPNPVGLAAGFDKNGIAVNAMAALGFGFAEIGSITAKPSSGNPKPRLFRLEEDFSVINRMGLNNDGAEAVINRLKTTGQKIPLGINIAKTNDSTIIGEHAVQDYCQSYLLAKETADYITINISCPNTEEGKTFEEPEALKELLGALNLGHKTCPVLVKFSVDLEKKQLRRLIEICEDLGISGYVAANTSSQRQHLTTPNAQLQAIGKGGLSGAAIASKSTEIVKQLYEILQGSKPIIGVGGIDSPQQAIEKIKAGANLIQLYTGLIFEGPALVKRIKKGLRKENIFL